MKTTQQEIEDLQRRIKNLQQKFTQNEMEDCKEYAKHRYWQLETYEECFNEWYGGRYEFIKSTGPRKYSRDDMIKHAATGYNDRVI